MPFSLTIGFTFSSSNFSSFIFPSKSGTPFPKIKGWVVKYKCVRYDAKKKFVFPPPAIKHFFAFISSNIDLGLSFLCTTIISPSDQFFLQTIKCV